MIDRRILIVFVLGALAVLAGAGCRSQRSGPEVVPTVASLDALATALPLTQNAPPPPWNNTQTRFARIDDGLNQLPGAQYTVLLQFDGVVAETGQVVNASAQADVTLDQLTSARRVLLSTQGELIGQPEDSRFEAVKLGEDAFLVRDGVCLTGSGDALAAATLSAGDLVGSGHQWRASLRLYRCAGSITPARLANWRRQSRECGQRRTVGFPRARCGGAFLR